MQVRWHPEAQQELQRLPLKERAAVLNAVAKLAAIGVALGYPHTSQVQGAAHLRELRPRAGRSAWRAFYRRIGDELVIGSIGPEAKVDPQGFRAAVAAAQRRLDTLQQ
jgi:phage-related protein